MQKLRKYVDSKKRSVPSLYRDEVTKIFYLRDRVLGKISLETDVEKTAISKIYEAREELKRRHAMTDVSPDQNLLFKDIYKKMHEMKVSDGIKPETIRRMETIWKNSLEPYWANIEPKDLSQELVDKFKVWHQKQRPDVQFVNVFKYLGNLIRIGKEYGHIPATTKVSLSLPRPEEKHHASKKGRVIKDSEFKHILPNIHSPYNLIARIGYYMGMRKMEIGALEKSRVVSDGGNLYIDLSFKDTKTGIARTIPVPDFLAKEIKSMLSSDGPYVFPRKTNSAHHIVAQGIDRAWREAKNKTNISGRMRFHDLRHTAATNMARADISAVLAVTYLGMSLRTYQKVYLKLTKEDLLSISKNADRLFVRAEVSK